MRPIYPVTHRTALKLKEMRKRQTVNGRLICPLCTKSIEGEWNVDHKVPRSKGGTNKLKNLHITHVSCNTKKADKSVKIHKIVTSPLERLRNIWKEIEKQKTAP